MKHVKKLLVFDVSWMTYSGAEYKFSLVQEPVIAQQEDYSLKSATLKYGYVINMSMKCMCSPQR